MLYVSSLFIKNSIFNDVSPLQFFAQRLFRSLTLILLILFVDRSRRISTNFCGKSDEDVRSAVFLKCTIKTVQP